MRSREAERPAGHGACETPNVWPSLQREIDFLARQLAARSRARRAVARRLLQRRTRTRQRHARHRAGDRRHSALAMPRHGGHLEGVATNGDALLLRPASRAADRLAGVARDATPPSKSPATAPVRRARARDAAIYSPRSRTPAPRAVGWCCWSASRASARRARPTSWRCVRAGARRWCWSAVATKGRRAAVLALDSDARAPTRAPASRPPCSAEMGRGAADIAPRDRRDPATAAGSSGQPAIAAEQARFRFFDSMTTFLKKAARRQPLVLILDDLHWADHPSLLLLQFLAREIADAPLLLVGTYRDVEVSRRHPLRRRAGRAGARAGQSSRRAAPALRRGRRPLHGGRRRLDAAGRRRRGGARTDRRQPVLRRRARSPARLPTATGSAHPRPWPRDPRGVQDVIAARLDRLSSECQQASCIARRRRPRVRPSSWWRRSAAECDRPPSRCEAARRARDGFLEPLDEALRAADDRARWPGAVCTYSFSHALIRDALYAELSSGQRVRLHRSHRRIAGGLLDPLTLEHAAGGAGVSLLRRHFRRRRRRQGGHLRAPRRGARACGAGLRGGGALLRSRAARAGATGQRRPTAVRAAAGAG